MTIYTKINGFLEVHIPTKQIEVSSIQIVFMSLSKTRKKKKETKKKKIQSQESYL